MNLDVVAKGVEREDQLQILKSLGCDFGQGFLFGEPVPGDEVVRSPQDKYVR